MNWKFWVRFALPLIENAGQDYIDKDENETGKDDMIGQSLIYVAKLLKAIIGGTDLPKAPEALR